MKLDICLQGDIFNVFRNTIWDTFAVDCSKYIKSCSLSIFRKLQLKKLLSLHGLILKSFDSIRKKNILDKFLRDPIIHKTITNFLLYEKNSNALLRPK